MKAKSISGRSTEDVQAALQQSMADGFTPTLAIVFMSIKLDHKAICKVLDEAGIAIFGATTNGEFIDEKTQTGSVVILLMDMNPEYFTIFFEEYPNKNYRETSAVVANKSRERFSNPAFLLSCSHTATDAEELLMGFEDIIGKNVNVYGGAAGDDFSFSEQFIFTNSK